MGKLGYVGPGSWSLAEHALCEVEIKRLQQQQQEVCIFKMQGCNYLFATVAQMFLELHTILKRHASKTHCQHPTWEVTTHLAKMQDCSCPKHARSTYSGVCEEQQSEMALENKQLRGKHSNVQIMVPT